MWQLLLFIIFIILIQKLNKGLKEQGQQERRKPSSSEETLKDIFQTMGFPLPEELPTKPKPEKPKKPVIKKTAREPEIKITQQESAKLETLAAPLEETTEELLALSQDKLEQAIILTEILSPPKAYQIRRGGGIGIRAGLKNR